MKRLSIVVGLLFLAGCANPQAMDFLATVARHRAGARQHSYAYQPYMNGYGQMRQYAPAQGGGPILGPVQRDVYGPGLHMDATGRPVRSVPWP